MYKEAIQSASAAGVIDSDTFIEGALCLGKPLLVLLPILAHNHPSPVVNMPVCDKHGLMESAWANRSHISGVVNSIQDLRSTWEANGSFMTGTVNALERDLDESSEIRVMQTMGDGSLPSIRLRLESLRAIMMRDDEQTASWQAWWMLIREIYEAAGECV